MSVTRVGEELAGWRIEHIGKSGLIDAWHPRHGMNEFSPAEWSALGTGTAAGERVAVTREPQEIRSILDRIFPDKYMPADMKDAQAKKLADQPFGIRNERGGEGGIYQVEKREAYDPARLDQFLREAMPEQSDQWYRMAADLVKAGYDPTKAIRVLEHHRPDLYKELSMGGTEPVNIGDYEPISDKQFFEGVNDAKQKAIRSGESIKAVEAVIREGQRSGEAEAIREAEVARQDQAARSAEEDGRGVEAGSEGSGGAEADAAGRAGEPGATAEPGRGEPGAERAGGGSEPGMTYSERDNPLRDIVKNAREGSFREFDDKVEEPLRKLLGMGSLKDFDLSPGESPTIYKAKVKDSEVRALAKELGITIPNGPGSVGERLLRILSDVAREANRSKLQGPAGEIMDHARRFVENYPKELRDQFLGHLEGVVNNLPERAVNLLNDAKPNFVFQPTVASLRKSYEAAREQYAKNKGITLKPVAEGTVIGGAVIPDANGVMQVFLDGGKEHGEELSKVSKEIYAHELGHVVLSSLPKEDFQRWKQHYLTSEEIKNLPEYGQPSPKRKEFVNIHEGFAEVYRMLHSGEYDQALFRRDNPETYRLLNEMGLAEKQLVNGEMESRDIFKERIPTGGEGDPSHADAMLSMEEIKQKEEDKQKTLKERFGDTFSRVSKSFHETWNTSSNILHELTKKAGAKYAPRAGDDALTVWSRLQGADPKIAGDYEAHGPYGIVNDVKHYFGMGLEKVVSPLTKEDMRPYHGEESQASLYATARHVLAEAKRGREAVGPDLMDFYRKEVAEVRKDPEKLARFDAFADNITQEHLAMKRSLASVGYLTPEFVQKLDEKRPDYVPLNRKMEESWKGSSSSRNAEHMRKMIRERGTSDREVEDQLVSLKKQYKAAASAYAEQLRRTSGHDLISKVGEEYAVPVEAKFEKSEKNLKALNDLGIADEDARAFLKETGEDKGLAYFSKNPWSAKDKNLWWYVENGKSKAWEIKNRELYDLLTHQQGDADSTVKLLRAIGNWGIDTPLGEIKPVSGSAKAVTYGATRFNTVFNLFRNTWFLRDPLEFGSNTIKPESIKRLPEFYKRAYAAEYEYQRTGKTSDVVFDLYKEYHGDDLRQLPFDEKKPSSVYDQLRQDEPTTYAGKAVKNVKNAMEYIDKYFKVIGAGEGAPRALEMLNGLEQHGYDEARLTKMKARGERVPEHIMRDVMEKSAEVTVNFPRQGTITKEITKVIPFFGPQVAGMSKTIRNWQNNPKGAAVALGAVMGLRLLYWSMFNKETWYKELTPYDRFNNFVVPVPGMGLIRFPGARDLHVPAGGLLITALDTIAKNNPDYAGLIAQSLESTLPPGVSRAAVSLSKGKLAAAVGEAASIPTGAVGGTMADIARNQTWAGNPLVPKKDADMGDTYNLLHHQGPYAIQQLTGGRGELSLRGAGLIPFSQVNNANRSVEAVYDRLHELNGQRQQSQRSGERFAGEAEYQRLQRGVQQLGRIGQLIQGSRKVGSRTVTGEKPDEARVREYRQRQVEIARALLGLS